MRHQHATPRGFTLIEITIVIAVLAILAAVIAPMLFQQLVDAKVAATRTSAKQLHEAIAGKPDVAGSYGFVGDMGRLPADFQELLRPSGGALPYHTDTFRSVGMGWRGPYVNAGASRDAALRDAFGRDFRGAPTGRVESAGADGEFGTPDDIGFPPMPYRPFGRVLVTVKRMAAEDIGYTLDPPGYTVRLYYSNNGQQVYLDAPIAPFVFENVPQGVHAVAVLRMKKDPPQVVVQDTIEIPGGGATRLVQLIFRL
jgi:prepilin-type N-terminal cleavage/methylation domain-containing protein